MGRLIVAFLIAVVCTISAFEIRAEEAGPKNSTEVKGQVVILKEKTAKPVGPIDPNSLIIADIPDSGSRPPQDIKVDGGTCVSLGHVRGVATNDAGQSLMGGGYTWYLFKAPSGPKSVHVRVSYVPNGGKQIERDHQVHLNPPQPPAKAAWTPPANPNPHQILGEAQGDATAGRYEVALAKHVWFHRHALQHQPSLSGVRLSFALMYWKQLGTAYPPAKAKLLEIRDEAEKQVTSGNNVRESFQDFVGINSSLGEDKRTATLFTALDKNNPNVAKELFNRARPALIKAGETKLCGKYVDPKEYDKLVAMYRRLIGLEADPNFGKQNTELAQQSFSNQVSTLVALLVLSDRNADGEKIAADAKTVFDDKAFAGELEKALEGKVPEPWSPAMN